MGGGFWWFGSEESKKKDGICSVKKMTSFEQVGRIHNAGRILQVCSRDYRPDATKRQTAIKVIVANFDEVATQRPLKMNNATYASIRTFNATDWGRKDERNDTDYRNDN